VPLVFLFAVLVIPAAVGLSQAQQLPGSGSLATRRRARWRLLAPRFPSVGIQVRHSGSRVMGPRSDSRVRGPPSAVGVKATAGRKLWGQANLTVTPLSREREREGA
jgi:hypothetical protein